MNIVKVLYIPPLLCYTFSVERRKGAGPYPTLQGEKNLQGVQAHGAQLVTIWKVSGYPKKPVRTSNMINRENTTTTDPHLDNYIDNE